MKNLKSNFIWNTLGSGIYSVVLWLLTIIIARVDNNLTNIGLLALCMAISNVGFMFAAYSVRSYQVSDTSSKFSQSDYVSHRLICIIITFIGTLIYCLIVGYSLNVSVIVTSFMLFRLAEAFIDVCQGIHQKHERLDIAGKSNTIRSLTSFSVFLICYYTFRDLLPAFLGMIAINLIQAVLYDYRKAQQFEKIRIKISKTVYFAILTACFSPFVFGLCVSIVPAIPRLYLERLDGQEILGIFSAAALPAVIVQLVFNTIFFPFITLFSDYYKNKDKRFKKAYYTLLILLLILGFIATILAMLLGKPILTLLYDEYIAEYSRIFTTAVIANFLAGMMFIWFILLTVMRKLKTILIGCTAGIILAAVLTATLIPSLGIDGINYVLMMVNAPMFVIAVVSIGIRFGKVKWEEYKL
jgi:O-antigen/teichoic acid export membrane protein